MNIQNIVISNKITLKNKNISNITKKITFAKISSRLFFHKNHKNLKIIMKFKYFQYENDIVSNDIQIAQQMIVKTAKISTFNNKKKKKFTFDDTIIIQLFRDLNVRENLNNKFDQRLKTLQNLYDCFKIHCKNIDKHCFTMFDHDRHVQINQIDFIN